MTIERIVRPFQANRVFSARVLPPTQEQDAPRPNVVLEITSKADSTYVSEPPPIALGFQADWQEDKSRRVTDRVRIENPDDREQFLIVDRIRTAVYQNTKTGEEIPLKMDWTP